MRRDLADQRDVFFFYLAVISWAMSSSVIKTFADERLLTSNLGTSFLLSYSLGEAVNGKSTVLETYPSL